jgi:AhpD family alkylhydroperoxidase
MIIPDAMQAILALKAATEKGGVPSKTLDLVHLRASQINDCSACVDAGTRTTHLATGKDCSSGNLRSTIDRSYLGVGQLRLRRSSAVALGRIFAPQEGIAVWYPHWQARPRAKLVCRRAQFDQPTQSHKIVCGADRPINAALVACQDCFDSVWN